MFTSHANAARYNEELRESAICQLDNAMSKLTQVVMISCCVSGWKTMSDTQVSLQFAEYQNHVPLTCSFQQ